jgi:iron complex transport system substrate-binding protein
MMSVRLTVIAIMLLAALASAQPAEEPPRKPTRVVSLNMCVDELVLRLAERTNIASVTWLSRNPDSSNVADLSPEVPDVIEAIARLIQVAKGVGGKAARP